MNSHQWKMHDERILKVIIGALLFVGAAIKQAAHAARAVFGNFDSDRRSIMRALLIALATVFLIMVTPARATLLHVDAQAAMTDGEPNALIYMPIGTVVNASVDFDLGPGNWPVIPPVYSASGTFTWNDGGPRTFNVSNAELGAQGNRALQPRPPTNRFY